VFPTPQPLLVPYRCCRHHGAAAITVLLPLSLLPAVEVPPLLLPLVLLLLLLPLLLRSLAPPTATVTPDS
jgi:hypothetical protein